MNIRWFVAVSLVMAVVAAGGCKRPVPAAKLDGAVSASVTDEEARQWADQAADALQRSDMAAFSKYFNLVDVFEKGIQSIDIPAKHRKAFLDGLREGAQSAMNQWTVMGQEGTIRVLRVRRDGEQAKALLRCVFADGAVNYLEFSLGKMPDGTVIATDCYPFLLGQTLGDYAKSMAMQMKATIDNNKPTPEMQAVMASSKAALKIREGDFAGAFREFDALPEAQKNSAFVLRMQLVLAMRLEGVTVRRPKPDLRSQNRTAKPD